MSSIRERFKKSWNVFRNKTPTEEEYYKNEYYSGEVSYQKPDRIIINTNTIRSVMSSIFSQIAVDISNIDINHVRLDEEGKLKEILWDSSLNQALTIDPNIDQIGRDLKRDIVISMFDEGCVAVVPTEYDSNPEDTDAYKVYQLRVAKILEWRPQKIRVEIYNDLRGIKEERIVDKRTTAIIENPFYLVMNEPNSTAKRLVRILNQIDRMNETISSNKFDLLLQLPYSTRSEIKKMQAKERQKELEDQLDKSRFGIGFIDATEKVIQLNRPVENTLWNQALDLLNQLFAQLGFSKKIFDGTATEAEILVYQSRTLEPILNEIVECMEKKWISKTARSQGQAIRYFKDPFKLVSVTQLAEASDSLSRNEIMTSNEIRSVIGLKPSKDPKADELRNSNLNHPEDTEDKKVLEIQNE